MYEFRPGDFGLQTYSDKFSFWTAVTRKSEEVLVVQVHLKFVQIWLEGNRRAGTQIKRFAAGFIAEFAQVVLRGVEQEERAADVAGSLRVDAPNIDVALFGDGNAGEEMRRSERRSPVDGQRFIQSMTERYGLE